MNRVQQLISIIVLLLVSTIIAFQIDRPEQANDSVSWQNEITVEKNDRVIDQFYNELTNQGKVYIAGKLFGNTSSNANSTNQNFTYISVGNGAAVSPTDSILDEEFTSYNLSRSQASSVTSSTVGTYTLEKQFTADLSSGPNDITVNTTGLNYNVSGNSLISGGNFTEATLTDGDQLTVTHEITISGS